MRSHASAYRPDIQGIRALAVMAVMLFHYDAQLLSGGFIGVDVFLVISGYLMTSILLSKRSSDSYALHTVLQHFYVGRIKRIVPAYFAMLIVVSLASAVFFIKDDFNYYVKSLEGSFLFSGNRYFSGFGDYFAPATSEQPLLHTWSLAVEMQFYLLYPLLVLLLPLRWLKVLLPMIMLVLMVCAEYMLRFNGKDHATYYALYARIPEFLAGAFVQLYGVGKNLKRQQANQLWLSGLVLILASAILFNGNTGFPGLLSIFPVAGAVMLLATGGAPVSRILSGALLVWLGTLSYSLYLWHWPVLALIRYCTGTQVLSAGGSVVFILITLFSAFISWCFIECSFQDGRRCLSRGNQYVALIILVSCVGFLGFFRGGAKVNSFFAHSDLSVEYRRYADPDTICHGSMVRDCLKGDLNGSREVLVLGDSHAAMLNKFFDYLGKEFGFKARVITASSCVTIPTFNYEGLDQWAQAPCRSQIESAKRYIADAEIIFLAASWNWQLKSPVFSSSLNDFVSMVKGKRIFILSQEPLLDKNPLRALRIRDIGFPVGIARNHDYLRTNEWLANWAAGYSNVRYLSFNTLRFFDDAPFYNGELMYYDEHHLNERGADEYAKALVREYPGVIESVFAW